MVKLVQNSYRLYSQHLREEQEKKKHKEREKEQAEAHKRKLSEMKQEEKRLHDRLDQLTSEHGAAKEAMQRAIRYVKEGGEKIKNALKVQDMMEVEAGYKSVEFGKEKQRLQTRCHISWMKGIKLKRSCFSLQEPRSQKLNSLVESHQSFFQDICENHIQAYVYCSNTFQAVVHLVE